MTREIVHADAEIEMVRDARMTDVEACLRKMFGHGVVYSAPLPVTNETGESPDLLLFKAQRLADFARSGAAAIADDVGGHCRAGRGGSVGVVFIVLISRRVR